MTNLLDNGSGRPAKVQRNFWPPNGLEASWTRLQPLLTPAQLLAFHLFGIPLVSAEPNPITGERQVIPPEQLGAYIERAVELAEAETGLTIMSTEVTESISFDRNSFESHGYFQLARRPVWGVERLTIRTPNAEDLYSIPTDWITYGGMFRGRINLVPLTLAFASTAITPGVANGAAGAAFLASIGSLIFVPCYWGIDYFAGWPDGMVPMLVNELLGCICAMEILSMLGATYARVTSASVSVDGLGQSVGMSGPNLYQVRLADLQVKRDKIVSKLKIVFGLRFGMGTV